VNASRELAQGGRGHEYQPDDYEFERIAEDTAEQLLRRTAACGCQWVLCTGRRGEIKRRDGVWLLVTSIAGASDPDKVLRLSAVNGLIISMGLGIDSHRRKSDCASTNVEVRSRRPDQSSADRHLWITPHDTSRRHHCV
jgi:hypothetical protein